MLCPKCQSKSWKLYKGFDGLVWSECRECRYAEVGRGQHRAEVMMLLAVLLSLAAAWVYMSKIL